CRRPRRLARAGGDRVPGGGGGDAASRGDAGERGRGDPGRARQEAVGGGGSGQQGARLVRPPRPPRPGRPGGPRPGAGFSARGVAVGGEPDDVRVPYFDLTAQYAELRDEILSAVDRVCRQAAFILGEEVARFEEAFAAYCEARHCIALNSGTSALHLALLAVGVQPRDEVITPANTFSSTAEAVTYTGARPVFVDIDPRTANIDPRRIEAAITPRTRAIVPVHLYGRPADWARIREIAERRDIPVIE